MDLLTRVCTNPTRELLKEQLAVARNHMPKGMPMHEVWIKTMNDPRSLRTMDDALYFVFVFLAGCPGYTQYVSERTNKRTMDHFLPMLREKFVSLILGRAPGGKRAASPADKEFQGAIDFTMAIRSIFLRS